MSYKPIGNFYNGLYLDVKNSYFNKNYAYLLLSQNYASQRPKKTYVQTQLLCTTDINLTYVG